MKHLSSGGFTVVESLIVLAISGALFVSTVAVVSGQQAKAQFRSAMTDITSKMQSTINEAASGYYPPSAPFKCNGSGGGGNMTITSGNPNPQGGNEECMYLGRAMMFGIPDTDPQEYIVHTVVGLRQDPDSATGKEALTFEQARAEPVANQHGGINVDLSETKILQYGLKIKWMRGPLDSQPLAGVAFVMNPSQASYGTGSELQSGATTVSIIPIESNNSDEDGITRDRGIDQITDTLQNGAPYMESARICFENGATGQSALMTIGGAGGGSTVDYQIYANTNCTP